MKTFSVLSFAFSLFAAAFLASCTSTTGVVTVNSGKNGTAGTESGLKIVIANWTGGVITITDILEEDAHQIPLGGGASKVGQGFIWVPGGQTASSTVITFPIAGTFSDGTELNLMWFDVEHQTWISFAGVRAVVDGSTAIVTLPLGASGLGGNFAVAG